jgi:hypothetical protein
VGGTGYWWKDRAWRIVQTNMREIDMIGMDAKRYVAELKAFHANTVIINTGGIVSNYKTKFDCQTINPNITGDSLEAVIAACKDAGIRVISRVDFSKVRKPIYEKHPDWAYVSPKGSIIDYFGDIHVCFNSEYQQKLAIEIMREIITRLDSDGIFMNMGGYSVGYDYTNGWQGICQCDNCRARFHDMFGLPLPQAENTNDPAYQKYILFQKATMDEYYANIRKMVGETKPELLFFHDNMLRHEAGTWLNDSKQNYLYKASELLKVEKYSYPEKVSSVTSVDFIDMLYRFAAVSPHQQELRIAQTLAGGGFADYYMVGRLDTHPDKSGFEALQRMFKYHKDNEADYHSAVSHAKIALVKPSASFFELFKANPDEYFGWYFLLTQRHYLFDCIESERLEHVPLDKYETIILPDVSRISMKGSQVLDAFVSGGGTLIATGESAQFDEVGKKLQTLSLESLGVKRVGYIGRDIISAYFQLEDKNGFKHFDKTDYVYLHTPYCYAEYKASAVKYLKLIPPHRHSPAESAYHTNVTDYPAFTVNPHGKGRGVFIPWKPGNEYYKLGFPQMDYFMTDVLEGILGLKAVGGSLPPAVEVEYTQRLDGTVHYVHLINETGFFCQSFFEPITLTKQVVEVSAPAQKIASVKSMVTGRELTYEVEDGILRIFVDELNLFEAIKIQ